jgi:hypothetical protein
LGISLLHPEKTTNTPVANRNTLAAESILIA